MGNRKRKRNGKEKGDGEWRGVKELEERPGKKEKDEERQGFGRFGKRRVEQ